MLPSRPPACFPPHTAPPPAPTGGDGVNDDRGETAFTPTPTTPGYRLVIAHVNLPTSAFGGSAICNWLAGRI